MTVEFSGPSIAQGALAVSRGAGRSVDTLRPRTAQLLNCVSEVPTEGDGWSWARSMGVVSPPDGYGSVPPTWLGDLHAPVSF